MNIFHNHDRPNYYEVAEAGPKWWTKFREMDANYKYAGWTLDLMADFLERFCNNQFPALADERTIRLYETILQIEPEEGETLEERRRTVSAYYSGTGKLSKSGIQAIIKQYGNCESELWWEGSELQIRIFCDEDTAFSNRKIYMLIERRFPAHLSFMTRNMLCVFELSEEILVDKSTYRMPITWWGAVLDGKYLLDGSLQADATFPPFFLNKYPVVIENVLQDEFTAFRERLKIDNDFSSYIYPIQRVMMNWWEEYRTLDGQECMNGFGYLDQDVPPAFFMQSYRQPIETAEDLSFTMYIPGKAKHFNGAVMLDGSINLNSGREEL